MKILARTSFLHGRQRFEAGIVYAVPDAVGAYFVANGWAEAAPVDAPAHTVAPELVDVPLPAFAANAASAGEPATLAIDNGRIGVADNRGSPEPAPSSVLPAAPGLAGTGANGS